MKTAHLILLAAVCLTLGYSNGAAAQESAGQEKKTVEKVIRDRTYIYTYYGAQLSSIHNSKNYIDTIKGGYCEHYGGDFIEPIDNIFDSVFPTERKEEMKGRGIIIVLQINYLGEILEVKFMSKNLAMLTLEEVYALETALLKYKFKMTGTCPDKRYYLFVTSNNRWLRGNR